MNSLLVYNRHNIYKGENVDLKKGSYLEQDVLVAHGSSIGENSTLFKAVVGKSTKVGKDVALRDCIIGSNVAIGDGCHLTGCVIGDNVVIGSKANISHRYIKFRYSVKARIIGPILHLKFDASNQ